MAANLGEGLSDANGGPVRHIPVMLGEVLAMLAPWNVEAIGAPERRSPLMVPALKLSGFAFTSVSDAI